MDQTAARALGSADDMLAELSNAPPRPAPAPTMGRLQKVRYTHAAMIDLLVEKPWISQNEIAMHFGFTPAWISNILASDAFQAALAARREEVIDPVIKATIEERMRALYIKSLEVLQAKLSAPQVSDTLALRAAELGARGMGVGGHGPPKPPEAPSADRLVRLAERLVDLQANVRGRIYEGQVIQRESLDEAAGG